MKTLLCFLAGVMALVSCSSSDDGNNPVLLEKMIQTSSGGTITTLRATYDGNRISEIISNDGFVSHFTYTGDLITKREYKSGETLLLTELYQYDNNQRLALYLRLQHNENQGRKEVYLHADDGTILMTAYEGDLVSQENIIGYATITFLDNGEVGTIAHFGVDRTYTYDSKNNPFRNIAGYSKISWVNAAASGILHNITSESFDGTAGTTTSYTYNDQGYPVQGVKAYSGGGEAITDYIYY